MKKLLSVFVVFWFVTLSCKGQTEKGKFIIAAGSNLGPSYTKYSNISISNRWSFNADIKGGYFILNNFAIGLRTMLEFYSSNSDTYKNKGSYLGLEPFARYYYVIGKFGLFAEARGGVLFDEYKIIYKNNNPYSTNKQNSTNYTLGGGLGVNYFLNENVALELSNSISGRNNFSPFTINTNFGFLILF